MVFDRKRWLLEILEWLKENRLPIGVFLFASGFDIFNLILRPGGGFILGVDWMMHWCLTWDVVYYHWIWGDYNFGWGGYDSHLWYYPPAIHVIFAGVWLLHGAVFFSPRWAWNIITRERYKRGCYLGFIDSPLLGERGTNVDIRITMALIDGVAVALTYLTARRLSGKEKTALFASLIVYFNAMRMYLLYKGHLAQIAAQCFSVIFIFLLIKLEESENISNTWIVSFIVSSSLMFLTHLVSVGLVSVLGILYFISRRMISPRMSSRKTKIAIVAFLIGAVISWQVFWSYAWEGTLAQKDPNVGGIEFDFVARLFKDWTYFYVPLSSLPSYNGLFPSLLAAIGLVALMGGGKKESKGIPVGYWIISLLGIYLFGLPLSLGYRIRFLYATIEPVAILASVGISKLEGKKSNSVKFGMILYLLFKIWFGLEFLRLFPQVIRSLSVL